MVKQICIGVTALLLIFIFVNNGYSYDNGFEKETIERLARLETKVEGLQRQIDDIKTFMLWGFGILFAGMMTLIGFVLWDRKKNCSCSCHKEKQRA